MRFFLYGTLLQGACNGVATALHRGLEPGRAAVARGALHAIPDPAGWYPALLPDPAGAPVHGMVHETGPAFTPADLAALDAWEGTDYARAEIPVEDGGLFFMAHAWLWTAPLPPGALAIPEGDFRAFAAAHGLAEFR